MALHTGGDVDVLIDLNRSMCLFELSAIHRRLEGILGREVDLTTEGGMKPW